MRRLVLEMHRGSEGLPLYDSWIREHLGGRVLAFRERLIPNILVFTDLRGLNILDFGCGTGSTTVVLAEAARDSRILGVDIDPRSLEIARLRLQHHGLDRRVGLERIPPVRNPGDLPLEETRFDFILANGVLEHVTPFRLRSILLLELWRLLRPGGLLYVSETPNLLWPVDRHTTGLPLVPWLPTSLARRLALAAGRTTPDADLDANGRRGMTFWGVVRPLRRAGHRFEVLNVTRAGNRLWPAGTPRGSSRKRRLATALLESFGPILARMGIPTVAFAPFLEHLCLRKLS
jgi:SAM-dependent methyltransferase